MKKVNIKHLTRLLLLVAISFIANSCARNPVTGKRDFMLMSEKREVAMGKQSDPAIQASFGVYKNARLQTFIHSKGQSMARISHRNNIRYEFKVLDSPVVNAFAVPGGYVYFTRGILAHFNNEAEFAGVLGHEIGHITARHSAKQYSKSIVAQVGLIAGMVLSPQFAQYGELASQGLGLLFLKFGRDAESQSDRLGVEYSTKIGYDSKEMASFFHTLNRLSSKSGAGEMPTFLSTHPHPLDRFEKVGELTKEWQSKFPKKKFHINRNSYLKMIDGLLYGEDPKQGYVERNVFYHPDLKFQFPVPNQWRLQNSPQQVQMGPKTQDAAIIFSLAQEKSLGEAAGKFVQQTQLKVRNSGDTQVNGLRTKWVVGDYQDMTILTYFINYNNKIYKFHGLAKIADYRKHQRTFETTFKAFNKLTDQSKINVMPERIKIETATSSTTLGAELKKHKIDSKRHNELAILNGMELSSKLKSGTLYKIVEKKKKLFIKNKSIRLSFF